MKKTLYTIAALPPAFITVLTGYGPAASRPSENNGDTQESADANPSSLTLTAEIAELASGLSAVRYEGDYGFDCFGARDGAAAAPRSFPIWPRIFALEPLDFPLGKSPLDVVS